MPIKLKKENIQFGVDPPKEGYIFLGFNETGRLVYKDSDNSYGSIVPTITTGNFEELEVTYLTLGYRLTGGGKGLYTIAQGENNVAAGLSSFAQGDTVVASGLTSIARGQYVIASGDYAFASGKGVSNGSKLFANGINSFVHSYATTTSGTHADYSVILGGYNHLIETGANRSVIIGGTTNSINTGVNDSAIIACNNVTSTIGDTVYVPRLILDNSSTFDASDVDGTIEWNGSNFRGRKGGSWVNLDSDITVDLSTEVSNRSNGDSSLSTALSSEISSRSGGDSTLSSTISSSVSSETSSRISGDSTLSSTISSSISSEVSTRSSVDSTLSSSISSEVSTRSSVDTSLSTVVYNMIDSFSTNAAVVTSTNDDTCAVAVSNIIGFSITMTPRGNKVLLSCSIPFHPTSTDAYFVLYFYNGSTYYFGCENTIHTRSQVVSASTIVNVTPNSSYTFTVAWGGTTSMQYLGSTGTYGRGIFYAIDLY